jgi:hypothetical protein
MLDFHVVLVFNCLFIGEFFVGEFFVGEFFVGEFSEFDELRKTS